MNVQILQGQKIPRAAFPAWSILDDRYSACVSALISLTFMITWSKVILFLFFKWGKWDSKFPYLSEGEVAWLYVQMSTTQKGGKMALTVYSEWKPQDV